MRKNIQRIGNILLNLNYWDCECKSNFIHPTNQKKCNVCGTLQEEAPASRENEVQIFSNENNLSKK